MSSKRWMVVLLVVVCGLLGLSLVGCEGGSYTPRQVEVKMTTSDTFSPSTLNVEPGFRMVFFNDDIDPHTVVTDPGNVAPGGPNSDILFPNGIPAGQSYEWTVPSGITPGTAWYFHCRFHGTAGDGSHVGTGMVGLALAF